MQDILNDAIETILGFLDKGVLPVVLLLLRVIAPVMTLYVVWRCYTSFRKGVRRHDPVIMLVDHHSKVKYPILYWENSIGRARSSDIVLDKDNRISRDHAVLLRRNEGWMICDTESKTGIYVNGKKVKDRKIVGIGDEITMGTTMLTLMNTDKDKVAKKRRLFTGFSKNAASPFKLMMVSTLVLLNMAVQLFFSTEERIPMAFVPCGVVLAAGWGLYIISIYVQRHVSFELETIGFLLSGIGIMLIAGQKMSAVVSQAVAMIIGMAIFCVLIWFMGDLQRVHKFRYYIGIGAILLFVLTLLIGKSQFGSKSWIIIGGMSIQPSELIKIAFILFGASTLDVLQTKKNITEFLIFTGICLAFLFVMKDFGTALIFFACFLVIAFMRSGSMRTIILVCAAALFGVVLILQFKPHVMARFDNWGNIWNDIYGKGYQQANMLTYLASGGLFGLGLGQGYFKGVPASGSDLVFGVICEEQGLLMGLVCIFAIVLFIFYARSDVTRSRSTYYSITSCAAVGLMIVQMMLNLFGSTDIIPFTGVTIPFLSAGGSSLMCVWGLLGFLKAADERTYAARRMTRKQIKQQEKDEEQLRKIRNERGSNTRARRRAG